MDRTPPTARQNVAATLAAKDRGMTWLARRLGVNRTNLYLMLDGERPMDPTLPERIAEVLEVPARLLFAGTVFYRENAESPEQDAIDLTGDEPNGEGEAA